MDIVKSPVGSPIGGTGTPIQNGGSTLPQSPLVGTSNTGTAVTGTSFGLIGISGTSQNAGKLTGDVISLVMSDGVYGEGKNGVHGVSAFDNGVLGENSAGGCGVTGTSAKSHGVHGTSGTGSGATPTGGCGIYGESHAWPDNAIFGSSNAGHGVHGVNGAGSGTTPVWGCGIWGESAGGFGVYGASKSGIAGQFEGNVAVTGDITATGNITATDVILSGADCAEEFYTSGASLEVGTVAVLDDNGALGACGVAYDKRVAGVISGAGEYRPGIILDRRQSSRARAPIALVGKVYCKVDASYGSIEVGDMLTTSPTPGSAMKASDSKLAFGAVIGKALRQFPEGRGMIPILVSLQ